MPRRLSTRLRSLLLALIVLAPARAAATEETPRQALGDAWWTGPLLAPSPATLPRGHILVEPYLFDVRPRTHIDRDGNRTAAPRDDNGGSLTYLLYGLTDEVTVGAVPHFGYRRAADGGHSSGVGVGDLTVQAQYRLRAYTPGSWAPALGVVLQESLPIGRYDRLEGRSDDGFGSGAYATTLGLYSQTYFWTPNGRILRTRLDLSYTVSADAKLRGQSVYGTPSGFRGRASPGDSFNADLAFEYSVTRNWVLAMDLAVQRDWSTRVSGTAGGEALSASSGPSHAFIVAPAVEYNFNANVGVIVGARVVAGGRNVTTSVAPVIAVNYVR